MKYSFQYRQVLPLIFALLIENMCFTALFPIIATLFKGEPYFFFSSGTPTGEINAVMGLAYALMPIGLFFGASILGDFSDRYGRKKILILAMIGIAVGFFLFTLGAAVRSLSLFLVGRLLSGLMSGAQAISQAAIVDISPPEKKALNMSFLTLAYCGGFIIGPILTGMISQSPGGIALALGVVGILSFISAFWIWLSFEETHPPEKNKNISWIGPLLIFIRGYREKKIRILIHTFFLFQLGISIYFQSIMIKLQSQHGYELFRLGLFTAFIGLGFLFALGFLARIVLHRVDITRFAIFQLLLNGVFLAAIAYMPNLILIWVLAGFMSIVNALGYTALLTVFSDAADHENQGKILGISVSAMAIAFIVGGAMMGLLTYVGVNTLLFFGGIAILFASLSVFQYHRKWLRT